MASNKLGVRVKIHQKMLGRSHFSNTENAKIITTNVAEPHHVDASPSPTPVLAYIAQK
jgi:hypothetical protein